MSRAHQPHLTKKSSAQLNDGRPRHTRRGAPPLGVGDLLALLALVVPLLAWAWPAVTHGLVYGSFPSVLSQGIGSAAVHSVHNPLSGDQADQIGPWINLDWKALHSGSFPFWNPWSGLGLPQFADFQAGVLSLPALLSYLAPLRDAYAVQVLAALFLAGSGIYAYCRTLGVSRAGSLLAGACAELAGPLAAWAGWPLVPAVCLVGWALAFLHLLLDSKRLVLPIVGLTACVAFTLYAGSPELVSIAAFALVYVVVLLVARAARAEMPPLPRLGLAGGGVLSGALLALPFLLPALRVVSASVAWGRTGRDVAAFFSVGLLSSRYYGSPLSGSSWFAPSLPGGHDNYYEVTAYVGAAVLALAAGAFCLRRLRSETAALGVAVVALFLISYRIPFLEGAKFGVPLLRSAVLSRSVIPMALGLCALAGIGVDALLSRGREGRTARWVVGISCGGLAGLVGYLIASVALRGEGLSAAQRSVRLASLLWPAGLLVGLGVSLVLLTRRPGGSLPRLALFSTGLAEVAFLVVSGWPLNTWNHTYLPQDRAIAQLRSIASGQVVATDAGQPPTAFSPLGIVPELNGPYRIAELGFYADSLPRSLRDTWASLLPKAQAKALSSNSTIVLVPSVSSVAQAKELGTRFILTRGRWPAIPISQVRSLVRDSPVSSSPVAPELVQVLSTYLGRPDLQAAFPATSSGLGGLYSWASKTVLSDGGALDPAQRANFATHLSSLESSPALSGISVRLGQALRPPPGVVVVGHIAGEELYEVKGAQRATFSNKASGSVTKDLSYTNDNHASVAVSTRTGGWLELRITDVAGWHATAEGKILALRPWEQGMIEVKVPPGTKEVSLYYRPAGLGEGLGAAAGGLVGLILLCVASRSISRDSGRARRRGGAHLAPRRRRRQVRAQGSEAVAST